MKAAIKDIGLLIRREHMMVPFRPRSLYDWARQKGRTRMLYWANCYCALKARCRHL